MTKESKRKLLFITVILAMLLISSAYAALIPNVHAAKITTTSTAKGLTIINQVAGVDLTKYNATPTLDVAGSYLGVLPTENIRYTLTGSGSRIEIQDTFTNGSLQIMDVLENIRSPQMPTLPASDAFGFNASYALVEMAKGFLLNYQGYSANSFYGQLASSLNQADPTKNSTTTVGNLKFDINTISGNSTLGNSTSFTWSYTSNGIDAACKCVSLGYKDGFLNDFIDTWNLYPIGSTIVNLSEQQAEDIAMQNAKAYSWTIGSGNEKHVINNFNVTRPMIKQLEFCPAGNASNARSSDPLTLYPMWGIGVGLDKFYPGDVYGIYVDVWADTGQVRDVQEVFSTLPPPAGAEVATIAESSIPTGDNQASGVTAQSNMFPAVWVLAAFVVFTMGAVPVWLSRKKTLLHSLRLPKLRKIGGAVLCLLIGLVALVALVSAVPTVNAGSAIIWGDSSDGTGGTLPHTPNEISNQSMISTYITSLFQSSGYAYYNKMQGVATIPQNVQTYVPYVDQYYPPAATVWFDHGVGMQNVIQGYPKEFHFMLCGTYATNGNPSGDVFDYQIYSYTSTPKNYFSFISACMSAALSATYPNGTKLFSDETGTYGLNNQNGGSTKPIGMPFAWTHGASISNNGYVNPDSSAYCYVGFPYGSAPLSQQSPPIDPNYPTITYGNFVSDFFYNALSLHDSVNQALYYASQTCWSKDFSASTLYNGFTAYWQGVGPPQPGCTMVVYGNGNMYLYTGSPIMLARHPSVTTCLIRVSQTQPTNSRLLRPTLAATV